MKRFKRLLTLGLSLLIILLTNLSVLAADTDTYLYLDNTSLEPEEITYSITVPVSMELTSNITSQTEVSEDIVYKSRGNILVTGTGIKEGLTITASSSDATDSGDRVTLTTEDGSASTENGTFRVGDVSGITQYQLTQADYDAVTTTGLEIEVAIEGVTNASEINLYEGGLIYSVSEEVEIIYELSEPGLYDTDNNMICTYADLVDKYGLSLGTKYTASTCTTSATSMYSVLKNNPELAAGTKLVMGNDIISIGEYAFTGCDSLEYVRISNSIITISKYAFSGCTGLKRVKIPSTVYTIEEYAFSGCTSLDTVTVPNSVQSIGNYVFQNCSSLTRAVVGNGVSVTGSYLFNNCRSLNDVSLPNTLTTISSNMFSGCKSLEEIDIPDGVTQVAIQAFEGCGLIEVILPESVTYIGKAAYNGNKNLEYVYLPNNLKTLDGEVSFGNCPKLAHCFIPSSITSINASTEYYGIFRGCASGIQLYSDAATKPSGWGDYWNCLETSGIRAKANWGVTREEYYDIIGR